MIKSKGEVILQLEKQSDIQCLRCRICDAERDILSSDGFCFDCVRKYTEKIREYRIKIKYY